MHLALHLLRLRVLSVIIEEVGQIARGIQSVSILRPEHPLVRRIHLAPNALRLRVLPLSREGDGKSQ